MGYRRKWNQPPPGGRRAESGVNMLFHLVLRRLCICVEGCLVFR